MSKDQQLKEQQLRELQHAIWRNIPRDPTSFSACINKCDSGRGARGGGECLKCLIGKLAELVGKDLARDYVDAIRALRRQESVMEAALLPPSSGEYTREDADAACLRHDVMNSIPFVWGLASVDGAWFRLLPTRGAHTDDDVAKAKQMLKNNRDAVGSIKVTWLPPKETT